MFIELLDQLRCPRPHEDSWLVLAAGRTEGRDVYEGVLGCPVCKAEYSIVDGLVRFAEVPLAKPLPAPNEHEALRLAAALDLTSPQGYVILVGAWGNHATALHAMSDAQLMLVNPPAGLAMGWGLSGLTMRADWIRLPLASASARAIALDDAAMPSQLDGALDTLGAGGRLVAPASLRLPDIVTELARDERHWVAERTSSGRSSGIVSLTRRGR